MSAVARMIESAASMVVSWAQGVPWWSAPRFDGRQDVVLTRIPGTSEGQTSRYLLTAMLEPELTPMLGVAGLDAAVQNFRYVGVDGISRRLLLCGSCGDVVTTDLGDLGKDAAGNCRRCGAERSGGRCSSHHHFGKCPACAGRADAVG